MLQHTDYGNFRIYQQNAVNYLVQVVLSQLGFAVFFSLTFSRFFFAADDGDDITHFSILCNFVGFLEQNTLYMNCAPFWYLVSRYYTISFVVFLEMNNTQLPYSKRTKSFVARPS